MELLFAVKAADIMAKNPIIHEEKLKNLNQAVELFQEIKEKQECVNLKMLHVNGKELIAIGIKPGKGMGDILDRLLMQVLDNPSLNEKQTLLKIAKEFIV
jgi:tRNA nucleotidyltransferase (CCA-adding enzyme)